MVGNRSGRRLDLKAAAEALGTTSEAVRKRAKRGTLDSETGPDGRLYFWVDDGVPNGSPNGWTPGEGDHLGGTVRRDEMVERMASEIDHLREQLDKEREANRENRRLLAAALERIPGLEPTPEATENSQTPSGEQGDGTGRDGETGEPRRSWLARFFGLQ